jgi:hypothetical protein
MAACQYDASGLTGVTALPEQPDFIQLEVRPLKGAEDE